MRRGNANSIYLSPAMWRILDIFFYYSIQKLFLWKEMTLDDAALKVTTYTLKLSECLSCPVCGDLENEKDWHRKTWINCYENISLQHWYFDYVSPFFLFYIYTFWCWARCCVKYHIPAKKLWPFQHRPWNLEIFLENLFICNFQCCFDHIFL